MVVLAGTSAVLSPALLGLLQPLVSPDSALAINYLSIVRNDADVE